MNSSDFEQFQQLFCKFDCATDNYYVHIDKCDSMWIFNLLIPDEIEDYFEMSLSPNLFTIVDYFEYSDFIFDVVLHFLDLSHLIVFKGLPSLVPAPVSDSIIKQSSYLAFIDKDESECDWCDTLYLFSDPDWKKMKLLSRIPFNTFSSTQEFIINKYFIESFTESQHFNINTITISSIADHILNDTSMSDDDKHRFSLSLVHIFNQYTQLNFV